MSAHKDDHGDLLNVYASRFLRDLATQTRAKVLLTSRRTEEDWLASLPERVALPPKPVRERLQLAQHPGPPPRRRNPTAAQRRTIERSSLTAEFRTGIIT